MAYRTEQWGACPKCYGSARWTELRPVPGGYAGNYQCQLDDGHHEENVPLFTGGQAREGSDGRDSQ